MSAAPFTRADAAVLMRQVRACIAIGTTRTEFVDALKLVIERAPHAHRGEEEPVTVPQVIIARRSAQAAIACAKQQSAN